MQTRFFSLNSFFFGNCLVWGWDRLEKSQQREVNWHSSFLCSRTYSSRICNKEVSHRTYLMGND